MELKFVAVFKETSLELCGGCSVYILLLHGSSVAKEANAYRILMGKLQKREHLEDVSIDERIVLIWVLRK
jgi:hypothetical protein